MKPNQQIPSNVIDFIMDRSDLTARGVRKELAQDKFRFYITEKMINKIRKENGVSRARGLRPTKYKVTYMIPLYSFVIADTPDKASDRIYAEYPETLYYQPPGSDTEEAAGVQVLAVEDVTPGNSGIDNSN